MKKTDINKYNTQTGPMAVEGGGARTAAATAKVIVRSLLKVFFSLLLIFGIAGVAVGLVVATVVVEEGSQVQPPSLDVQKLDYNSVIYVQNEGGQFEEYLSLHSSENRVWVNFSEIPEYMKDAIIAIEDKRFEEHNGVDWKTTFAAVGKLFTGGSGGGSTITQQLIKNITGKNEVSILRKVREIFMALKLEEEYSKDEILEAYLNIVHFGSGCNGVEAAAQLYFGKNIQDCTLAECAAIAGITQNPYKYNPLVFPENNKERQQLVLEEMYDQGKISKAEYDEAMEQSEHMTFVGYSQEAQSEEEQEDTSVWNWYIEDLYDDVTEDLMELYDCDKSKAEDMLYHSGLKIYCAMDSEAQKIAEEEYANESNYSTDGAVESGFVMMDYSGRILATVGSRQEKTGNLWFSYATDAKRQPGSTIKPIGVYAVAMDQGLINYSSMLKDEYVENYFPNGAEGPHNASIPPQGTMLLPYAIAISQNTTAAQLTKQIGPTTIYDFLTQKLHFENLNPQEDSVAIGAMSIGGLSGGMTVKEVAAAYQIFGNGGQYNEPYTYYYVEDHDGNRILDNTTNVPEQVLSSEDATVMNHLLHEPIYNSSGTAQRAAISGWDVFGKTGTTDSNCDAWFVGGTPYAVAAVWSGYPTLSELPSTRDPLSLWKAIMTRCLENKDSSNWSFALDSSVISAEYCKETGLLASDKCTDTATGWYQSSRVPSVCTAEHKAKATPTPSPTAAPTVAPTTAPTAAPTPTPTPDTPEPTVEPTITPEPTPAPTPTPEPQESSSEPTEEAG